MKPFSTRTPIGFVSGAIVSEAGDTRTAEETSCAQDRLKLLRIIKVLDRRGCDRVDDLLLRTSA